jgi:hypothetical protein
MAWSKRTFPAGEVAQWAAVQDQFVDHYTRCFPKHWSPDRRAEMMLVMHSDDTTDMDTLYMALPAGEKAYEGFQPISFTDIPKNPALLVGDQAGYNDLFPTSRE